jgi:hypothetical protein
VRESKLEEGENQTVEEREEVERIEKATKALRTAWLAYSPSLSRNKIVFCGKRIS